MTKSSDSDTTQLIYNSGGTLTGSSNLTYNGSALTLSGKSLYVGDLTGTAEYLLGVDSDGKIIETEIEAIQEDFDLIDFIELTDISSNTDTVIPAGYKITSFVFEETGGTSSVTIDVGTTSGGTDIINSRTVGSSSLVEGAIGTSIFSKTSSQQIYIESSSWSTAVVDISIRIEKFTE